MNITGLCRTYIMILQRIAESQTRKERKKLCHEKRRVENRLRQVEATVNEKL